MSMASVATLMRPRTDSQRRLAVLAGYGLLLVAAILVPFVVTPVYVHLAINVMISAIFALSFNVLYGYSGLPSFGHAAYYGIGAYTIGMGMAKWGWPFWFTLAMTPVFSAIGALLIGIFCVRLKIIYFAMLTMAFSQLLYFIVQQTYDYTDGDNGLRISGIPSALHSTAHPNTFFYVTLVVTVVSVGLLYLILHSPFGYALKAIRENSRRAESLGLDVRRYQLASFVIAGTFAGVAGGVYGVFAQYVFPKLFFWDKGAEPLLMAILGGVNSFFGPILGAILYQLSYFFVIRETEYVKLFVGGIIIVTVLAAPRGIVGLLSDISETLQGKRRFRIRLPFSGRVASAPAVTDTAKPSTMGEEKL